MSEQQRDPRDLRDRTKRLAVEIVHFVGALPQSMVGRILGGQLLRSGTSVGAHYREGCRARSPAEFISKLEDGLQELEESAYWLELLQETRVVSGPQAGNIYREVDELIAMFVSSVRTVKARSRRKPKEEEPEA